MSCSSVMSSLHDDPGAVHLVDPEHVLHELLGDLRQLHRVRDGDASRGRRLYDDVGRLYVDPDARVPELLLEEGARLRLEDVDDEEDEVGVPRHREDPLAQPPSRGRALDDPGEVEDLYPRALVVQDARDDVERGELVRRYLRLRVRQPVEQGGLADAGQADEDDRPVAGLLHVESDGAPRAPRLLLLLLQPELRELPLSTPMWCSVCLLTCVLWMSSSIFLIFSGMPNLTALHPNRLGHRLHRG